MPRRRRSSLSLSAEEARRALGVLIHDRKIAVTEVKKALKRREQLVRELKSRLAALGDEAVAVGGQVRRSARRRGRSAERASRPTRRPAKRAISAATRKMYQTQGRYIAALRQLSKNARKQVKAIREKSGVNAAIAAAKRMAK